MHVKRRQGHSAKQFFKNTIAAQIHFVGFILAIIGLVFLLSCVSQHSDVTHFWACFIFGVTSILVFASSSLLHFMEDGFEISSEFEEILTEFDHYSIYLFIAGTYTPFLLNVVSPPWRQFLLVTTWVIAILGIVYTRLRPILPKPLQNRFFSTGLFIAMGWTIIIRIGEILSVITSTNLWLLIAGGVSYTIGAIVFATKRPHLLVGVFGYHELWHLFVMLGFGFHYFLILNYYQ